MQQRENRRIGADAECERHHDEQREQRLPAECPDGEAEIVDDYDLVIDTLLRAGGATGLPNDPEEAAKVRESMHGTASKRYVIHIRPQRIVSWNHAKLKGTY